MADDEFLSDDDYVAPPMKIVSTHELCPLGTMARIRELEAIVRRFVVFDPYPDSTLTKDARVLLAGLRRDRGGEHG